MALTGTFGRNIDEKLRLAIPPSLRQGFGVSLSGGLYVAPGNDGCLAIYSEEGFERFASRLRSLSIGNPNVRKYLRLLYSQSEQVTLDKQGRIRLPERLRKLAGLEREAVLLGVNDHAEIWDKKRWESFFNDTSTEFDDLTTEALDSLLYEPPKDG